MTPLLLNITIFAVELLWSGLRSVAGKWLVLELFGLAVSGEKALEKAYHTRRRQQIREHVRNEHGGRFYKCDEDECGSFQ